MKLSNKTAMVTGGGSGIGRAIALTFAKEGANVVVADIQEESARRTASEIEGLGCQSLAMKVDVRSSDEIDGMIQKTLDEFGRIDILVNCAGVNTMALAIDLTEKEWDYVMDVNAKGAFLCSKAVARLWMKKRMGGRIINISSNSGKTGEPYQAHYCASKFAIIGLTQSMATELAPHKIFVNAVCPDFVEGTEMQERLSSIEAKIRGISLEELERRKASLIPVRRMAKPEEVANFVTFLASEDAAYMTGQSINFSGGFEVH